MIKVSVSVAKARCRDQDVYVRSRIGLRSDHALKEGNQRYFLVIGKSLHDAAFRFVKLRFDGAESLSTLIGKFEIGVAGIVDTFVP